MATLARPGAEDGALADEAAGEELALVGPGCRRFLISSCWRAFSPPPQDVPLALCDGWRSGISYATQDCGEEVGDRNVRNCMRLIGAIKCWAVCHCGIPVTSVDKEVASVTNTLSRCTIP